MTTLTRLVQTKSELLAIQKILVPSDFSAASDKAFQYALNFSKHFGAQLHVIHVLEPVFSPQFAGVPDAPAFFNKELAAAEENFHGWAKSVGATGAGAKLVLRNGFPAHEIVEAAKELAVDLVIIATQGLTGWRHFCIGSTAEQVARAAPCPVLVVREKEHEFC